MRTPLLHAAPPAAALGLAAARWLAQGSGNVWTALGRRFYVADPDLGWRVADAHPVWLGLDALAALGAFALGVAIVALVIARRERRRGAPMRRLRAVGWPLVALPLAVPAWAFATGGRPAGAVDALPAGVAAPIADGIDGALDAPAGAYQVVAVDGAAITAHLAAGGEAFDARFAGGLAGAVTLDPRDLAQPLHAAITVDAASVDTGVGLRSKHAREEYLRAAEFPTVGLDLERVVAAHPDGHGGVAFRAAGVVHLIGRDHRVEVTGTARVGDAAAAARLGVRARPLLVQADLTLHVHDTALAPDAGDFDRDEIPVHASLVLIPKEPR